MKYTAIVALMLMAPVVLLAGPKNSANVTFTETVTINGISVPPATITLSGKGPDRPWRPPSFKGRSVRQCAGHAGQRQIRIRWRC